LNKILYSEDILSRISVNYNEIIVNNNSVPVFDNGSYTITDCIVENIDNEFSIEYLINLNANIYGGTPPYTLYGIDEDTPYASGVIYTAFVEDANGCISNTVTGRTICQVDECDGFAYIERQRTTFIDVEIPATENCLPITLEYDFYIYSYTEDEEPQISQFYYSHSIPSSYPNDVTFYVTISVGLDTYTITTNQRIYYEVIDAGSPFTGSGDYTVSVYMVSSDGCLYELATHIFDLTSPYEGSISEVINASGSTETITVPSGIIETYIEYSPIRPVLGASYECNEDGTAILQITASGGYEPYLFFGGQNGQVVNSNQTLELFVRGSNGCESEHVFLNVVCEEPIVCEPIRLSASLETTSVTQDDSLATLTFSYLIEDDDISADVDEVNVVCTALNTASQYMIGNPVFATFNIEFGAKQLFFDFTPNQYIPVTIRFNMSIKMDNGCVYTDTFTLSVNPSILSSTDNYSKELIG
jgi:hypothetical protein